MCRTKLRWRTEQLSVGVTRMTERHLHSVGGRAVGRLRLSPTPLGCGWVVTGMSQKKVLRGELSSLSAECGSLDGAAAVMPPQGRAFFLSNLGGIVDCVGEPTEEASRMPPLCSACKRCSECKFRRERCSVGQNYRSFPIA